MSIAAFISVYTPGFRAGGPIKSLSNMIEALGSEFCFDVYTSDRDFGMSESYAGVALNEFQPVGKAFVFYWSRSMISVAALFYTLLLKKYSIFYFNSFFSFKFSILPFFVTFLLGGGSKIIAPRGEFSEGALAIKSRKKRIFLSFAKTFKIYRNVVWQASSSYERADIYRAMGPHARVIIAEDIVLPVTDFSLKQRVQGSPLKIVFVSRISPMKNLLGAINVLKSIQEDVVFHVYGPIEDQEYWRDCCLAVDALPNNVVFRYLDLISPPDVISTMADYDLFFLPTLGENFGHVIAEALSAGLPILISDNTPWRSLSEKSIGWDIPLDCPEKYASCIVECCNKSAADYNIWRRQILAWARLNIGSDGAVHHNRELIQVCNNV